MFNIGAAEFLVIIIVAILVIGPKDMPAAMRTAGRWIGQVRRVSAHFRSGIDAMVREAELEEMEKKWKAQNEEIMNRTSITDESQASDAVMRGPPVSDAALSDDAADHGIPDTGEDAAPISAPAQPGLAKKPDE